MVYRKRYKEYINGDCKESIIAAKGVLIDDTEDLIKYKFDVKIKGLNMMIITTIV